jgi:hypothetical protein
MLKVDPTGGGVKDRPPGQNFFLFIGGLEKKKFLPVPGLRGPYNKLRRAVTVTGRIRAGIQGHEIIINALRREIAPAFHGGFQDIHIFLKALYGMNGDLSGKALQKMGQGYILAARKNRIEGTAAVEQETGDAASGVRQGPDTIPSVLHAQKTGAGGYAGRLPDPEEFFGNTAFIFQDFPPPEGASHRSSSLLRFVHKTSKNRRLGDFLTLQTAKAAHKPWFL